jgi:hypothetical protein
MALTAVFVSFMNLFQIGVSKFSAPFGSSGMVRQTSDDEKPRKPGPLAL